METEGEPKPKPIEVAAKHSLEALKHYIFEPKELLKDVVDFLWRCKFRFLLLIAAILLSWFTTKEVFQSKITTIQTSYSNTNSFLQGQLSAIKDDNENLKYDLSALKAEFNEVKRQKDTEILKLIGERDNAFQRLALFESMPSQVMNLYTNLIANAPTNLTDFNNAMAQLTNALTHAVEIPEFALYANDSIVTNGSIILLPNDRKLWLRVKNTSQITADNLKVALFVPPALNSSNVVADGWIVGRMIVSGERTIGQTDYSSWRWQADKPIYPRETYNTASITFSEAIEHFIVEIRIDVAASRSKAQRFLVTLVFP